MQKLFITVFLTLISLVSFAQSEVRSDSIRFSPTNNRGFGDFILNISLPSVTQMPKLDTYSLLGPDMTKDYSMLLQLDPKMTLGQGYIYNTPTMSMGYGYGYGIGWDFFSDSQPMQTATFKLNDNLRLSTYGQYRLDGTKMPNAGVLPWERNNFIGGMELRNKNFGIRIEVRRNAYTPGFPYYP